MDSLNNLSATSVARRLGLTLLHILARDGTRQDIATLIESNVNLDAADKLGWTPLHFAAFHGKTAIVKALLAAGANPNVPDLDGSTPRHWARCPRLRLLLKRIEARKQRENGRLVQPAKNASRGS